MKARDLFGLISPIQQRDNSEADNFEGTISLAQVECRSVDGFPLDAEYNRRFKEKHGVEYGDRPGVVNFTHGQAEPFRNAWDKIIGQLLV